MTPSPFTTYADTVCQSLKNATRRERKAIRQELEDHLTDHAEALVESGWDEAHATQHALDAMGDPNTIGEELNKAFPLRWFVLSRLTLAAFLLCCLPLVTEVPQAVRQLWDYHQAAAQPLAYWADYEAVPDLLPLDGPVQDLPEGGTLRFCGAAILPSEDGAGYDAYLAVVQRNSGPFRWTWPIGASLTFSWTGGEVAYWEEVQYSNGGPGCQYTLYTLSGLPADATPTAEYHYGGTDFTLTIPLSWEEVAP